MTFALFTWNLNHNEEAFRIAVEYLESLPSFAAVLTELPDAVADTATAQAFCAPTSICCLAVRGSKRAPGRIGLFSSSGAKIISSAMDGRRRMLVARCVFAGAGTEITLGCYHGVDQINHAREYQRDVHGVLARQHIDANWKTGPFVLLGDFNADPYDPEISSSYGMLAVRDDEDLETDQASALVDEGESLRPLFNPMWKLLAPGAGAPGTLRLDHLRQGIKWRMCDQIIVSRDLAKKIVRGPTILTKLPTRVRDEDVSHRTPSDHLPVQLDLAL